MLCGREFTPQINMTNPYIYINATGLQTDNKAAPKSLAPWFASQNEPIKMPRNMSFSRTTNQFRARSKTVTRRFGWWFLKPGDEVRAVVRSRGLKKGEKIEALGLIRILSVREEALSDITQEDCEREGFPELDPDEFIRMICEQHGCSVFETINRIEFEYL